MIKDVIGDNNIINCNITRIGPYPIRIMDVGVKLDLSIHDIDLIRFITGQEITEINHNISKVKSTTHEDSATFLCKMTDGTSCTIFNSWLSPFRKRSIEIFTDKNYYDIDLIRLENVKYTLCEGQSFSLDIKSYSGNALQDQLIAFINYIKNGDPHTLCLPREGFRALSYLV
jgi:predicted dehydrogenase